MEARPLINWIWGVVLVLGLLLLILGLSSLYDYYHLDGWQTTQATILNTEIKATGGTRSSSSSYQPTVTYQYTIANKPYQNNILGYGGRACIVWLCIQQERVEGYGTSEEAQEHLSKYRVGSKITIHYLKDDPSISYIERASTEAMTFSTLLGIGFLIGVFFYPILMNMQRKHEQEET